MSMTSSLFSPYFVLPLYCLLCPWIIFLYDCQSGFFLNGIITCFYSLLFLHPVNEKVLAISPLEFSHLGHWLWSYIHVSFLMGVCSQVFWRHRGSFLGCKVSSFIPYPHTVTLFQVLLNSHLSYCLKCIFDHVRATGENTPVTSRLSSASCCRKLSITGPQRSLEEYPVPHTAVQSQQWKGLSAAGFILLHICLSFFTLLELSSTVCLGNY